MSQTVIKQSLRKAVNHAQWPSILEELAEELTIGLVKAEELETPLVVIQCPNGDQYALTIVTRLYDPVGDEEE